MSRLLLGRQEPLGGAAGARRKPTRSTIVFGVVLAIAGVGCGTQTEASPADDERAAAPSDPGLRQRLTPLQWQVTQEEATEPPFRNDYWDNKMPGIYVDVVDGTPLFSSTHKYVSGTGWPSFHQPIGPSTVTEHSDRTLFTERTEVRSAGADSHLGHLFNDGPAPTGLRYCLNSAALRFVPAEELEAQGYGELRSLFADLETP